MKVTLLLGALAALATGMAIGAQATLNTRISAEIGPFRTGLWMNLFGGALAGLILGFITRGQFFSGAQFSSPIFISLLIAGALGIAVITGVSFSLSQTGVAAGLAAIFMGQMLAGLIIDSFGWGISAAIPLDPRRLVGLLVMGLAIYLLLPRAS